MLRARLQRAALEAEHAKLVEQALREAPDHALVSPRGASADRERMRALPIIGRGLSGEIPGTRPGVSRRLGRWSGR